MVALYRRGSQALLGRNQLRRPAHVLSDLYPDVCGVHAELDLVTKAGPFRGGTIYIMGRRARSNKPMNNTGPCGYCTELLVDSGARWVVFRADGLPQKIRL